MRTSPAGRARIIEREGRRLVAYRDSKGIWTIGVGHTGRMSPPPVTAEMRITEAACDALLAADLAPVEAVISAVKVPISQNEFDALASLGFNIGAAGLKRSSVLRKLNRGDVAGAADAFMLWDRPPALRRRRRVERAQFLQSDIPATEDGRASSVAAARAATLVTRAETARAKGHAAQAATAGLVVAGATGAATRSHHANAALVAWTIVLVAALVAALVAVSGYRAARTLAANAARQGLLAQGPGRQAAADTSTSQE